MNLAASASIQLLDFSDRKHTLHFGNPEQFLNTRAYTRDTEGNLFASTADVVADQHAEAERIHVGNLCQVNDLFRRQRIAHRRFEDVAKGLWRQRVVNISCREWPGESKYHAIRIAFSAFDCEPCTVPNLRFDGWHRAFLSRFWLFDGGHIAETTGNLAASQAASPPAISIRLVIPYWCRMLVAIEER